VRRINSVFHRLINFFVWLFFEAPLIGAFFVSIRYLYIKIMYMNENEKKLQQIISEELSKSEVNSMITNKINSSLTSREFKQKVKELSSEVVNELFKLLWQRNNMWKSAVSRV